MNIKSIVLSQFAVVVGGLAFAADTTDYSTYVQFLRTETSESDYGFSRKAAWSDNAAPGPGKKYYVPRGKVIASEYSSDDPRTFKGDELAIAGGFLHARAAAKTTKVPVLAFCDGGYFTFGANDVNAGRGTFSAPCTIIRSTSDPAQLRFPTETTKSNRPKLQLDVYGEADAEFEFVNTGSGSSTIGYNFEGALTNYLGTMTIADGACPKFTLAGNTIPATLKVRGGGILDMSLFSSDLTVGTLAWSDGGVLSFSVTTEGYAKVVVTNALQVSGSPRLKITGLSVGAGTPPVYPLLTLAGPAAEDVPDLSCVVGTPVVGPLPHWRLVVTANGDGTKTVSATYKEIVTLAREYSSTTKEYSAFYTGNEGYWSNNAFPQSGYDYYISSNMLWYSGGPASFAGDSFTIAPAKTVRCARSVTVNDLNFGGGTWMFMGANASYLRGKVTVWPGSANFSGYNGNTLTIDAPIGGEGDLTFTMYTGIAKPGISYVLSGDNSAFEGKVTITTPVYAGASGKPAVPDMDSGYYTKVRITDGNSLGGAYAGSDGWRAVTLEKQSRLIVANDVTLAEPTRGLFVSRTGYVSVADGATLALECPFTLGGELVKLGGGTLSLGGQLAFADGNPATEPTAETNRLIVSEGTLRVASTNACNGLAISFAAGTRLEIGVEPGDDALRTYGLYDVAWDAPISLAEGMEALPVRFSNPPTPVSGTLRLGICTLNPTAAAAFTPESFDVARVPKALTKVVRVENRDGEDNLVSVTFACDLTPKGFMLLVL